VSSVEIPAGDPTRYRGALTRCRKILRGEDESVRDPVQSKHQSPASRDSTTSMPPRSPSGRFLPAGSPLPEEPSRSIRSRACGYNEREKGVCESVVTVNRGIVSSTPALSPGRSSDDGPGSHSQAPRWLLGSATLSLCSLTHTCSCTRHHSSWCMVDPRRSPVGLTGSSHHPRTHP
jgi:hypothetical protein